MAQPPSQLDPPARHPFFDHSGGGHYSAVDLDDPNDDHSPPASSPSSPARASLEPARSTTRFALEDSLSSFATAQQGATNTEAGAADALERSSDSSQGGVEVAEDAPDPNPNPDAQFVLPNFYLPMPHAGRFEDIVDLVSQASIPPPPLLSAPRPALGRLLPTEDERVTRLLDPNNRLALTTVVTPGNCRMVKFYWHPPPSPRWLAE